MNKQEIAPSVFNVYGCHRYATIDMFLNAQKRLKMSVQNLIFAKQKAHKIA